MPKGQQMEEQNETTNNAKGQQSEHQMRSKEQQIEHQNETTKNVNRTAMVKPRGHQNVTTHFKRLNDYTIAT